MSKPTRFAKWAEVLAADGTSGVNNRIEPSGAKKNTGFIRSEKPPRQDVNDLFWLSNQWIEYFDSVIDQNVKIAASPTFANVVATTEVDAEIFKLKNDKFGSIRYNLANFTGGLSSKPVSVIKGAINTASFSPATEVKLFEFDFGILSYPIKISFGGHYLGATTSNLFSCGPVMILTPTGSLIHHVRTNFNDVGDGIGGKYGDDNKLITTVDNNPERIVLNDTSGVRTNHDATATANNGTVIILDHGTGTKVEVYLRNTHTTATFTDFRMVFEITPVGTITP